MELPESNQAGINIICAQAILVLGLMTDARTMPAHAVCIFQCCEKLFDGAMGCYSSQQFHIDVKPSI
jgi:hypothetical protein